MKVSKFAHNYRSELMMEHWATSYEHIKDPFSQIDILDKIAKVNANTYYAIFKCEPD